MARIYRAASYLLRRGASWYFPGRLTAGLRLTPLAAKADVVLDCHTSRLIE